MAVEELGRLIAEEQIRILRLSPADHRCALIELARAMDAFWVRTLWKQDDLGEPDDLYPFAWNKALSLFMDDACEAEGAPLIPSSRESQEWADSVLQLCGRIAFCEHLLELTRAGLVACSTTRADEYKFQPIVEPFGVESIERSDFQWVRELIADAQEGVRPVFDGARSMIGEAMSERVNRWRQHFIKYETSPEIDDYFEGKGVLCAQLQFGQDSFPAEANFGGIEFNSYRACLALLMGWNLKHFAFCRELLRKQAELDARNLSTVFHRRGDMADWVADAFGLDKQTWTTALDVLTLDRANLGYHTETVRGPAAPLMKIGADHVLQPLFGTAMNPFFFLLRELRNRFRDDWDRNVNERESAYRAELYQLFPQECLLKTPGNTRLRSGGATKTDIDAAVLDRKARVLGLFQLKWQDPFGFSMRERASRARNCEASCSM